jgi:hypothetical protein
MQISYLEEKDDRLMFKAESSYFAGRYGLGIAAGVAPASYSAATPAQRVKYAFAVSAASLTFPDGSGPYIAY